MTLDELGINETGIIIHIDIDNNLKLRLLDMGITEGVTITKLRSAPLGDPLEFSVLGYNIALRKSSAKNIFIEKAVDNHNEKSNDSPCREPKLR